MYNGEYNHGDNCVDNIGGDGEHLEGVVEQGEEGDEEDEEVEDAETS